MIMITITIIIMIIIIKHYYTENVTDIVCLFFFFVVANKLYGRLIKALGSRGILCTLKEVLIASGFTFAT